MATVAVMRTLPPPYSCCYRYIALSTRSATVYSASFGGPNQAVRVYPAAIPQCSVQVPVPLPVPAPRCTAVAYTTLDLHDCPNVPVALSCRDTGRFGMAGAAHPHSGREGEAEA
jgi:hypothetical protein